MQGRFYAGAAAPPPSPPDWLLAPLPQISQVNLFLATNFQFSSKKKEKEDKQEQHNFQKMQAEILISNW